MKFTSTTSVSLCLLAIEAKPASPESNSQIFKSMPDLRISGGPGADIADFPFAVSIRAYTKDKKVTSQCTGVLLSDRVVLTAATCFDNSNLNGAEITDIYVSAGSNLSIESTKKEHMLASSRINAPGFKIDQGAIYENIALIFLEKKIEDTGVKYAKMYPHEIDAGIKLKVAGWGFKKNQSPDTYSKVLLQAPVKTSILDVCKKYNTLWKDNSKCQICTVTKNNQSACIGDQGGPLVYDAGENKVLVGILSFYGADENRIACAENGMPTYYTNVYHHINWISEVTGISKDELVADVEKASPSDKISPGISILISLAITFFTFLLSIGIFA
ncbi:Plasma kallikrein [Zancudomyces culisetae]|uniref:Plasma kallikrein n=1 Tax=Zancudomyces culisetae TaxID=1213189 RepID=A0A1R1PNK5_ZANCU|nr:Plasma kallikrein [Zancudomyces culisetae]|eukprot:OMH82493.1 Plasma kallikrein [Zancudomyces culisetae]